MLQTASQATAGQTMICNPQAGPGEASSGSFPTLLELSSLG